MVSWQVLTWLRKEANGRPRSCAQANIWREAMATLPMVLQSVITIKMTAMTVPPARDSVALKRAWMYGCPVGLLTAASMLLMPKQKVKTMMKHVRPLRMCRKPWDPWHWENRCNTLLLSFVQSHIEPPSPNFSTDVLYRMYLTQISLLYNLPPKFGTLGLRSFLINPRLCEIPRNS